MGFPIHIYKLSMELPILYFKGSHVVDSNHNVFLSLKVVFIIANSADFDEMQHHAAFHRGLHCLPKYHFRGF